MLEGSMHLLLIKLPSSLQVKHLTQGTQCLRKETALSVSVRHRSYDALQYPLLFCYGEDGYNFMLKQTDPASNCYTNKKITAMDFYAHRLMVR